MSSTTTTHAAANVASIVERYRSAGAKLHHRRQSACGPSATDRQALGYVYECADADRPCSAKDSAAYLEISSASTTAVIDRLESVGLVTRQLNDYDRRSLAVVPVDRPVDPEQIDPLSERNATLAVSLDDDRSDVICQFLAQLADAVDSECQKPKSEWSTTSRPFYGSRQPSAQLCPGRLGNRE